MDWGHELPEQISLPVEALRDDQRLRRAENFINERVAYDNLTKDPVKAFPQQEFKALLEEKDFVWQLSGDRGKSF